MGRLLLVIAVLLFFASSAAPMSPGACCRKPADAGSALVCHTVIGLKNLLLNGLHFSQRCLHAAVQWSQDYARWATESALELDVAESRPLEPAS